jgi:hypothetical protein
VIQVTLFGIATTGVLPTKRSRKVFGPTGNAKALKPSLLSLTSLLQRLGRLPGSRKWRQVIALISGGAGVRDVAAATSAAAENQMIDASNDPAVKHSVWLLTQIPIAAKQDDFSTELKKLGLRVSEHPTLIEVVTFPRLGTHGGRNPPYPCPLGRARPVV